MLECFTESFEYFASYLHHICIIFVYVEWMLYV